MQITERYFANILADLIDENPVACRGILKISKVRFTQDVPTMAITLSGKPNLCVNLSFAQKHCRTEEHLKAVIVHEFLHVLLGHTERFKRVTPALNIALDAVINSVIHRTLGPSYSDMMGRFYKNSKGFNRLLRPLTDEDKENYGANEPDFVQLWSAVYKGRFVVDDLLDIAETVDKESAGDDAESAESPEIFLGNHEPDEDRVEISDEVRQKLHETLTSVNGREIWREPALHGVGIAINPAVFKVKSIETRHWEAAAIRALKECIMPDRQSTRNRTVEHLVNLPVLNEGDRRGFLRTTWSPLLPDIRWTNRKDLREGTTQIYLDVSGSMDGEMEMLVALIWKLRRYIRTPFWAFSDKVEAAVIKDGRLSTDTTFGTSMNCVLQHIADTRPNRAVVITDGYIEKCDPHLLKRLNGQQVFAIVSREGSSAELERARIPCVQLERFYND